MKCPKCQREDTRVLDSRPLQEGSSIRRRRHCETCDYRFSTFEEVEILGLTVTKKGRDGENYSREKLEKGIERSFVKLPLSPEQKRQLITRIEQQIQKQAKDGCISSKIIGDITMEEIKKENLVAYIRFACVYWKFENIEEFQKVIESLTSK